MQTLEQVLEWVRTLDERVRDLDNKALADSRAMAEVLREIGKLKQRVRELADRVDEMEFGIPSPSCPSPTARGSGACEERVKGGREESGGVTK